MTKDNFEELCRDIKQLWTAKDGLVAKLNRGTTGQKELTLCAGGHRNPNRIARICVLWEGDNKLYDGDICSADLKQLLTSNGICGAELTSARLLENNKKGIMKCYANKDTCKSAGCVLKNGLEIKIVNGITTTI